VLGVDDAHWLDEGSAALIPHLVMTRVASVVITLRSGEPAPDPVTALWKDGLVERIEVQALSRAETAELVEVALGGPVDGLTIERLWQLSQGNALYLRELIRELSTLTRWCKPTMSGARMDQYARPGV
jgi:predicted ATPase